MNVEITNRLKISDNFGFWFIGFFDGEGSLVIGKQKNGLGYQRIRIGQRSDDQQVLHFIKDTLGLGKVSRPYPTQKGKPVTFYQLSENKKLAEFILPLFDAYSLRTKKAKEYLIWREEVIRQYSYSFNKIPRKPIEEEIELTQQAIEMLNKLREYNTYEQDEEIQFKRMFSNYQFLSKTLVAKLKSQYY